MRRLLLQESDRGKIWNRPDELCWTQIKKTFPHSIKIVVWMMIKSDIHSIKKSTLKTGKRLYVYRILAWIRSKSYMMLRPFHVDLICVNEMWSQEFHTDKGLISVLNLDPADINETWYSKLSRTNSWDTFEIQRHFRS